MFRPLDVKLNYLVDITDQLKICIDSLSETFVVEIDLVYAK
jgi:hypothetical protein